MSEAEDARQPASDDIAGKTKRGLLWRFAAKGVAGVIELGVGIVLARLLMPEDYGIMALAYMVIGFIAMFQTIGLPQALVQRDVIDEDHKSTAFWTTLLMGFVLAGVMILLAGPAAVFFKEEAVRGVMYLLSVTMVFGTVGSVPSALLQRRIDFKRLFWPDIVGAVVYGGVGITMAFLGYSYWSLAWASIARGFTGTAVVVSLAGYVPRLAYSVSALRDLLDFGACLTWKSVVGWAALNVDYFIVGRYLPTAALGLYKKAYQWIEYPIRNVAQPAAQVMFPSLSRLQGELERMKYALRQYLSGVTLVSLPMLAVFAAAAPDLVPAVFGDQWAGAIVPAQILCVVGLLRSVMVPLGTAITARGYVRGYAITDTVHLAALAAGVLVGVGSGIVGVCWGVFGATVLNLAMATYLIWLSTGWGIGDFYLSLRAGILSAAAGLAGCTLVRHALVQSPEASGMRAMMVTAIGAAVAMIVACLLPEGRRVVRQLARAAIRALERDPTTR